MSAIIVVDFVAASVAVVVFLNLTKKRKLDQKVTKAIET